MNYQMFGAIAVLDEKAVFIRVLRPQYDSRGAIKEAMRERSTRWKSPSLLPVYDISIPTSTAISSRKTHSGLSQRETLVMNVQQRRFGTSRCRAYSNHCCAALPVNALFS